MSTPSYPIRPSQQHAFELAVAERLGIDPATAILEAWTVDLDVGGKITLSRIIDGDELIEMFNTGNCRPQPVEPTPSPARGLPKARLTDAEADAVYDAVDWEDGQFGEARAVIDRILTRWVGGILSDAGLAAFRREWKQADAEGDTGNRVRRGMLAAIQEASS